MKEEEVEEGVVRQPQRTRKRQRSTVCGHVPAEGRKRRREGGGRGGMRREREGCGGRGEVRRGRRGGGGGRET